MEYLPGLEHKHRPVHMVQYCFAVSVWWDGARVPDRSMYAVILCVWPVCVCARRYGIVCADNHTGLLNSTFLGVTRIQDQLTGHVLEINLPMNNLVGPIPESIGTFTYLKCVSPPHSGR